MAYSKVRKGDQLSKKITAADYNAMLDAATTVRQQRVGNTRGAQRAVSANASVASIQNVSGVLRERFTALALRAPVILPSDNQDEFNHRICMTADLASANDAGRWCVLIDTLPPGESGSEANGAIGLAVVSGVTICRINVVDVSHSSVEIASGSVNPVSGNGGLGTILWVAGGVGTASATGVQDAIIRIGGGSAQLPVGEYVFMSYQTVAQNANGFDFELLHPEIL